MAAAGHRLYLDCNATAPVWPEVADAVARALLLPGNPSSVHGEGRAARAVVEAAREKVAALVGASARQVIFTSGATESAALALAPAVLARGKGAVPARLLVSATEHQAVLEGHGFADRCTRLSVSTAGIIDCQALASELERGGSESTLVAVQHANSETGVIQPIAGIAAIVRSAGALLVVDAVQTAGKMPVSFDGLGADAVLLSAHKIGGPKGIGALVLGEGSVTAGRPMLRGGGQERGRRAGTENVAGIAGFGAAAELISGQRDAMTRIGRLRDRIEADLRDLAPEAVIFGAESPRLPNTSLFAVPGVPAETLLMALDLAGVAVSSGSACSSGKVGRSHVLAAMGVPAALAAGAIRVSLDWRTTEPMINDFLSRFSNCLAALGGQSGVKAAVAA